MLSVVLAPPSPSFNTPPRLGALACESPPLASRLAAATPAPRMARRLSSCFSRMLQPSFFFIANPLVVHGDFVESPGRFANEIKTGRGVRFSHILHLGGALRPSRF